LAEHLRAVCQRVIIVVANQGIRARELAMKKKKIYLPSKKEL
jgi:hypothetical protein